MDRQGEILERGGVITQETRGWDDVRGITVSQRSKESAHDYRYFPEPDLPPMSFSEEYINEIKRSIPELPQAKRERFMREFGILSSQADDLVDERDLADYFESAVSELLKMNSEPNFSLMLNYLVSDMKGILKSEGKNIGDTNISPEHFARLIALRSFGRLRACL